MSKRFFVTGTDTDAGKTLIACAILEKAKAEGLTTRAMKPLAAGSEDIEGQRQNIDAYLLQHHATESLDYSQVNPVLLNAPAAPHIVAEKENRRLSARQLTGFINGFMMNKADFYVVEGAGGWYVPLSYRETVADAIKPLNLSVILVVGLKLGCLNHALLTLKAMHSDGVKLAGWVGSQVDPEMAFMEENVETLKNMIGAPCLGVVPFMENPDPVAAASYLRLP
ncbi:MAG: dethiobiotin synthase [Cellvibrionales bacterium]|nr:dethiobiotin synthase [Cellvibrionales bacterium]